MTTITAVGNQKGGVGKTTVALCLASELTRRGRRVLLIDMDQQCSASSTVGGVTEDSPTIEDVLESRSRTTLGEAITKAQWDGIDVVAGSKTIHSIERDPDAMVGWRLRKAVENETARLAEYDHVLIDLPPALGTATASALIAADQVLAVTAPEPYSTEGLGEFLGTYQAVKSGPNPNLHLYGVLVNMVRSTNEHRYRRKELVDVVGDAVLEPVVPHRVAAAEVASEELPLHELKSEGARVLSAVFAEHAAMLDEASLEVKY